MTVSSTLRKGGPWTGNGVATTFDFAFKIFEKADIQLVRTVIATAVDTTLVLDSDYSVTLNADQNSNPGGRITYPLSGSALAATHKLTALSVVEEDQETDITNLGGFYPEIIEQALDKVTILFQQLSEKLSRTLRFSPSDVSAASSELPTSRANKYLAFDASGNAIVSTGTGADAGLRGDLAGATGSQLVNHTDLGVDAVPVSLFTILRGRVYAQSYGYSPAATAAVNAAAIMRCHNMSGTKGLRVIIPRYDGAVAMLADTIALTQRNVTLEGSGAADAYEDSFADVMWEFTAGNFGINLTAWEGGSAGGYASIENMHLSGANLLQRALWLGGTARVCGVAVSRCTVAGIDVYNLGNCSHIERVSLFANNAVNAVGLLVGSASGGLNTVLFVDKLKSRQNYEGIRVVQARGCEFNGGVVESNLHNGMTIYNVFLCNHLVFNGYHFENNWPEGQVTGDSFVLDPQYQVVIDGDPAAQHPHNIIFNNATFDVTVSLHGAMNIKRARYVELRHTKFADGAVFRFGADAEYCGIMNTVGVPATNAVIDNDSAATSGNWKGGYSASGPWTVPLTTQRFTATLTGISETAPDNEFEIPWSRSGNQVMLQIPELSGTGDAASKGLTGAPAEIIPPSGTRRQMCAVQDNGGATHAAWISIDSSGAIAIAEDLDYGGFANGPFLMRAMTFSYLIDATP